MLRHAPLRHRIARQPRDIDVRPLLERMHNKMRLGYLDRLAVIFHRSAGHILFQHVQRFEERIAGRFQRNPEPVELVLLISAFPRRPRHGRC